MRLSIILVWLCTGLTAQEPPKKTDDPWRPLSFLIGTWEAKTQGGSASAASSGSYTFQLELRDHILARHSANASCKGPADFNCDHGDLLYIYRDTPEQPLKAIYFDNEGHVIHYDVTMPDPNTAALISSAGTPGPQFRLVYELKAGVMLGRFQLRIPGRSDFESYLEWSGKKR